MNEPLHLNLANSILPLVILAGLSVVLPALLAHDTLSQQRLAVAVGVTLVVVWLVGAGIMVWLYASLNGGLVAGQTTFYLGRSALMGLFWVPVLGFVWLIRAQGVERRRGLRMLDGKGGIE